jgi:hypothetical protein
MPAVIVETCPVPECNLRVVDIEQMVQELAAYHAVFKPAFRRVAAIPVRSCLASCRR